VDVQVAGEVGEGEAGYHIVVETPVERPAS